MKLKFIQVIILIFLPKLIWAGGADLNPITDARSFSLNGLYFAGSTGLNSGLSNPAALSYSNFNTIEFSLSDRIFQHTYNNPNEGSFNSYTEDNLSIDGGIFWSFGNISTGIAYHPMIDYDVDWPFLFARSTDSSSVILAFQMANTIEINSISPSFSLKLNSFSIGLTANIYHLSNLVSFPKENEQWTQNIGLSAYQFNYDLDAWSFGGTLGLILEISDALRLGASVRSGFIAELKGTAFSNYLSEIDSTASTDNVSMDLEVPWHFGLGFLYKLNETITLNLDAAYSLWGNGENNFAYHFDNPIWQNRVNQMDSIGISAGSSSLKFSNTIDIGLGIEIATEGGMMYRLGYRFSQSPNTVSMFSYLYPQVDQHWISLGIGFREKNFTIDAAIAYTFGSIENIDINENRFFYGDLNVDGYIPSLTLRYNF